eukprot:340101_1
MEFWWFKQYVFDSSIWMLKSQKGDYMYDELLAIARNMSHDIINSMDSIYEHLQAHRRWKEIEAIKTTSAVLRQDHHKVGLLFDEGIRRIFETETKDEDDEEAAAAVEEMKSFIDSNLAINVLTSTATNMNNEFQTHVRHVMDYYGEFKPGPMKRVERCVSKVENDYMDAKYPKSAKLLDLVRCSVTFNTVDQLINGYKALMRHIQQTPSIVELSRVKNGFTGASSGGYRDIKVNVIYKSQLVAELHMICEIQLLLINYLQEKKRIHKLYSILREEIYFKMIVKEEQTKEPKVT